MYKFVKSSSSRENWYDHDGYEVCFWGRSNVGKSSLINALTQNGKLARVSKIPGRTQLLNYFENEKGYVFVDLPGYGYAKLSKGQKEKMLLMIDEYLRFSTKIRCLFLLIDSRTNITKNDWEIIEYLRLNNIVFSLVYTKIDKLNQKEKSKLLRTFKEESQKIGDVSYFMVSSEKNINIQNLQNHIDSIFENH